MGGERKIKFMLKVALMLFFAIGISGIFNQAIASLEDMDLEKAQIMADALTQVETQTQAQEQGRSNRSSGDEYKQRLGAIVVKEETPVEEAPNEIDTYVRFLPKRHAKQLDGSVGITQSAFEYSYNFKAFGKIPVQVGLGSEYISINNSTEVKLPAHLTDIAFGVEATLPFFNFKNTYFRFGATPSFPSDNWRVNSSAFRIPSRYFIIHQPNPKLTLIGGIAVFPSEESTVLPILGLIYQYNDKLVFNLMPKRPTIVYSLSKKLDLFLEGVFQGDEYQVKKDGYKKAILQYNEIHLGAGAKYSPNQYIDMSFSAGRTVNHYLKYRDSLGKVNIKNGLYTEFRVEAGF